LWEKTKHQFDPSDKSDDPANSERIHLAPLALLLGEKTLKDGIEKYNEAMGPESRVKYTRGGYVMIPHLQMQNFFLPIIKKIVRFLPPTSAHGSSSLCVWVDCTMTVL